MKGRLLFVVFAVFLFSSVIAFSPQIAFAGEITYPVDPGVQIVTYRDITNTEPTPPVTFSLDKTDYNAGETAVLSIYDFNANLDVLVPDFITSQVTISSATTVVGEETGPSTAIFNGTFGITNDVTGISLDFCEIDCETPEDSILEYTADSPEAPRARVTLPLSSAGNVTLKDIPFGPAIENSQLKAVTLPLSVDLVDGATFSSLPTVEISFANANLDNGTIHPGSLEMWHKAPGQSWEKVTDSCFTRLALSLPCTYFDNSAKIIKSDPSGAGFVGTSGEGEYALGVDVGVGGGGGGGLVRPSLVVNALAGVGGLSSGGGSAYSSPTLQLSNLVQLGIIDVPLEVEQMVFNHDSTVPVPAMELGYFEEEEFDYPLTINDKGFVLTGYSTTIETQTLETNTAHTIKFMYYESEGIQHFSLYTNLRDEYTEIHQSDTQLLYNDGQELEIVDPNGFFDNVNFTLNEIDDLKKEIVLEVTFAKPMDTSNIILRSWDPFLNSFDTHILDAITVVPDEVIESPTPTYDEPIIEELKSQSIPIWVKNNAAWWSGDQISDDDFVAGIEYLITNGIIVVPGVEVESNPTTEIPDWIKNNAGWWADSLITDDDFVESMQWLIENGVMQI